MFVIRLLHVWFHPILIDFTSRQKEKKTSQKIREKLGEYFLDLHII